MKASERDHLIKKYFREDAKKRNTLVRVYFDKYFEEDMQLVKVRGHDYAGEKDCLANLKRFALIGIVVRLSDKFSRLESLAKLGFVKKKWQGKGLGKVKRDSIKDTLQDIRNYSFLAQLFLEKKQRL